MAIFLGALLAKLIDPLAILLCAGSAVMIGAYRIAVPVGAAIYPLLTIGMVPEYTAATLAMAALAGAIQSAAGLFLWRRVPERFKKSMTDQ